MNYPNPTTNLTGLVPAGFCLASLPLDQHVKTLKGDATGTERLNFAPFDGVVEAIADGHSVDAVCKYLGVSTSSFHYWKRGLDRDELAALRDAEFHHLTSLDARLREIMAGEVHTMYQSGDAVESAELANKRMAAIEKLLKATQFHLTRLEARKAQSSSDKDSAPIYQVVMAPAALKAIMDSKKALEG